MPLVVVDLCEYTHMHAYLPDDVPNVEEPLGGPAEEDEERDGHGHGGVLF